MLSWALAAPGRAARPITPPAAEFPSEDVWINARPLTLRRLRNRRAVLVAFINTADVNSIRTFPVLKAWHRRYALDGLMVIGVHTPAYAFQRDPAAAREAVKRFSLDFPVVLDGDRRIWQSYSNEGWPAFYLIDHKGRIVFDRLGEGGYEEFESEIREAISSIPGYGRPQDPPAAKDPLYKDCGTMTPEINLGSRRPALRIEKSLRENLILAEGRDGEIAAGGKWLSEPDSLRLAQKNAGRSALIRLIYRGAQAFALLGPAGEPTRFFVRQDDLWLHAGNAGKDVEFDEDGRSYVTAKEPRLYELAKNPNDSMRSLTVAPAKSGAAVYGFQFSDQCLKLKLP